MKKTILLCLCFGMYFSMSGQISESVRTDQSALKIQKGDELDAIELDNAEFLDIPGQPQVPVYVESFLVPANAEVKGIKVKNVTKRKIRGTFRIEPAQPPVPTSLENETGGEGLADAEIYGSSNPFPGKYAEIISDRVDYGYHIVSVRTFPVEYIPASGEIYLCDFDYEIEYSLTGSKNANAAARFSPSKYIKKLNREQIRSMVKNKEDMDAFAPAAESRNGAGGLLRSSAGNSAPF